MNFLQKGSLLFGQLHSTTIKMKLGSQLTLMGSSTIQIGVILKCNAYNMSADSLPTTKTTVFAKTYAIHMAGIGLKPMPLPGESGM